MHKPMLKLFRFAITTGEYEDWAIHAFVDVYGHTYDEANEHLHSLYKMYLEGAPSGRPDDMLSDGDGDGGFARWLRDVKGYHLWPVREFWVGAYGKWYKKGHNVSGDPMWNSLSKYYNGDRSRLVSRRELYDDRAKS